MQQQKLTKEDKIGLARLEQLVKHLEAGCTGGHKEFDFSLINEWADFEPVNTCGTSGCAMGEFPIVWPDEFRFNEDGIRLIDDPLDDDEWGQVSRWLNLNDMETVHLFLPCSQQQQKYGGWYDMGSTATRHEVAANIRAFIHFKRNGYRVLLPEQLKTIYPDGIPQQLLEKA